MFTWSDFIKGSEDLFNDDPWKISIEEFVKKNSQDVFIHPTSTVEEGVVLKGPVYVGPNCFIGAHAYLRGGVYLMGNNSIGPGCEIKSSILFPNTNLAHFNFIGDSIIGSNVNFEAGSVVANHYNERTEKEIVVSIAGRSIATGSTKFGALVGDGCKIGANAVLSPGTILEKNTIVARQELVNQVSMENKPKGVQWRELFANKMFDLVIVILGVSIAFQLNNWKLNSDQKSLERFYKESLLVDVNADIAEITENLEELTSDRAVVGSYLGKMDQLPADSLLTPLLAIMSFETFGGNRNAYETIVASTGLNAIGEPALVEKLTDYYSTYTAIRRLESVYTAAIFEIHRHFSPHVLYDQRKIIDKSVVFMPQTRNSLVVAYDQLNTGVEDYRTALEKATALKTALEASL